VAENNLNEERGDLLKMTEEPCTVYERKIKPLELKRMEASKDWDLQRGLLAQQGIEPSAEEVNLSFVNWRENGAQVYWKKFGEGFFSISQDFHKAQYDTSSGKLLSEETFREKDPLQGSLAMGALFCATVILSPIGLWVLGNELRPSIRERRRKTKRFDQEVEELRRDRIIYDRKVERQEGQLLHVLGKGSPIDASERHLYNIFDVETGKRISSEEVGLIQSPEEYWGRITKKGRETHQERVDTRRRLTRLTDEFRAQNKQGILKKGGRVQVYDYNLYSAEKFIESRGKTLELVTQPEGLYIYARQGNPSTDYLDSREILRWKAAQMGANALAEVKEGRFDVPESNNLYDIRGIPIRLKDK